LTDLSIRVKFTIMAKKVGTAANLKSEGKAKKTSQGLPHHRTGLSTMNKHKRRSFKVYRGQGRP